MENKKTIQESVAEQLSNCGTTVFNTVIENFVKVEINSRVDQISKAITKQEQLEKDLKKLNKGDVVTFVGDNMDTQVTSMSKQRFEDIKKLKEKIGKLTKAIEFALENNTTDSYVKLAEALKKLDNAGGNKDKDTESDE